MLLEKDDRLLSQVRIEFRERSSQPQIFRKQSGNPVLKKGKLVVQSTSPLLGRPYSLRRRGVLRGVDLRTDLGKPVEGCGTDARFTRHSTFS